MYDDQPLLIHATWKVKWAADLTTQFEKQLALFMEQGGARVIDREDEHGIHRLFLETDLLPVQFGLLFGDAVHNLRSALDTAVSRLIVEATGKLDRRVNFPIDKDEHRLRESFGRGKKNAIIRDVLPDLEALILDVYKPWEAGNPALYKFSRLDNLAKHNIILLLWGRFTFAGHNFQTFEGMSHRYNVFQIGPGEALPIGASRSPIVVEGNGITAVELLVGGGQPFGGANAVELLKSFAQSVASTIQTLQTHFQRSEPAD